MADVQPEAEEIPHVDGEVGLPKAPGAAELQRFIDAGFTGAEIQAWKEKQTEQFLKGGFTAKEIDAYWGDGDPGIERMRQTFDANMELIPAEERGKIAGNTAEVFQAGLDYSATSLVLKPQEYLLPEDAGLWDKVVFASGQAIGDLPAMFGGFFIGGSAGGSAGAAAGGAVGGPPGAVTGGAIGATGGALFGAGAAPELIRQTAITMRRERGDGKPLTFREVMARVSEIGWASTKAGTVSLVGGVVGGKVGGAVYSATGSRVVAGGANIGSAALSMTATAAALDARVPDDKEFVEMAAIMVVQAIGLKAVGVTVGATRRFVASKQTEDVKANLEDIYVRTGIPPDILVSMAKKDPAVAQEILAPRAADGTDVTPATNRMAVDSVDPYYRPKLKIEEKPPEKPKAEEGVELTPEQKMEAQVDAQLPVVKGLENSPDRNGEPQISPKGAIGAYQIMPGTAKYYGLDPARLDEPAYNEMAARAVLKDLNEKFEGNLADILVAYNAGPGRAKAWIKGGRKMEDLPLETQRYLERAEAKGWLDSDMIGKRIDAEMIARDGDWVPPGGKPPGPPKPPGTGAADEPPTLPGPGSSLKMNTDMALEVIGERIGSSAKRFGWRDYRDMARYIHNSMRGELETARDVDAAFTREGLNLSREQMTVEDMVRQTYASRDRASYFIRKGTLEPIEFRETSKDNYILGYRQVKEDGGNLDDFIKWRLAMRHMEKKGQGVDTGIPDTAAEIVAADKSLARKYRRGADTIARVKDKVVDYYQESGRLTKAQAQRMKDLNREHIVMRRIFDPKYTPRPYRGGKKFTSSATLKAMKGSDRMIVDPVMADIDNIHFMVAMADMNRAVGDIVGRIEALTKAGVSEEMLPITKADADSARIADKYMTTKATVDGRNVTGEVLDQDGNRIPLTKETESAIEDIIADRELRADLKANQFIYWRDGKPEVWEARDPALVKLLNVRFPTAENPIGAALTLMARIQRAGIVFAPDFPIRSAIIGEFAKVTTEQYKTLPFKDFATGAVELITNRKNPEWYDRWIRDGGGGATLAELERKYTTKDMEKLLETTGNETALANAFRHPLEAIEAASMWIDTAGRLGTYKRLVNDRQLPGPKAAMTSRQVHLDHAEALAEAWANTLSRWVIFSRSVVKDLENYGGAIKRGALTTAAFTAAFVTLPTMLNWLVNKIIDETIPDEHARDRYSELPQYDRDNYYTLPAIAGARFKISRTYTAGYLYGAMIERALDAAWDSGEITVNDAREMINKWIFPGVIPSGVTTPVENFFNYDFLSSKPVVPASLEGNSPHMQYGPATTETAKKIAAILGQPGIQQYSMTPNPSPIWLDQYARAWGGPMFMSLLRELERPFKPARPREIADVPFVGAFFARKPTTDAASITKFYEDMEEVGVTQDDMRLAIDRGNADEIRLAARAEIPVKLVQIAKALQNQAAIVREINDHPDLTVDEKRGFIDKIVNGMIQLAKGGSTLVQATRKAKEAREEDE